MPPGLLPRQPSPPQHHYAKPNTAYSQSYTPSSIASSPTGLINASKGMMFSDNNMASLPPSTTTSTAPPTPSGPPPLDPPFRGYIESTLDSLLVFEAARRGMIPRVTRRLIERERGMVQSGAVFVFDEHESGIKRWTDGLIWSPSRILGNFLVYRETGKRGGSMTHTTGQPNVNTGRDGSPSPNESTGPSPIFGAVGMPQFDDPRGASTVQSNGRGNSRPGLSAATMAGLDHFAQQQHHQQQMHQPPPYSQYLDGTDEIGRPRSGSEGSKGGNFDRTKERQLVGSLTNSLKFKDGGLVKKTMSVNVNGFAQHMVSYYSVEDVLAGRLRTPSTIPELTALEISPEYLHKQNFRFPPIVEVGPDGVPRYRGEPDDPAATYAGTSLMNIIPYGPPEPMPYSASQYEIRDVKYEVAYPTQQLSNGSGTYYDQSIPHPQHPPSSVDVTNPDVQLQTPQTFNPTQHPLQVYPVNQTSWQPPVGCMVRPNPPAMLRQSSEGVLIHSRMSRRVTPYGNSPTASTFASAYPQQGGQSHGRIRRQSNSSSLNSPVSISFSPAISGGNQMMPSGSFDYTSPTMSTFPSSDPTQYQTPVNGHFYETPSSTYQSGGYRNPALKESPLNMMTSPGTSPLGSVFPYSPMDPSGPAYSGWPSHSSDNSVRHPSNMVPQPGDGSQGSGIEPVSITMSGRNHSSSGHQHPTTSTSLPVSGEHNSRRAELTVGFGGGVGMTQSYSQPDSIGGHHPTLYGYPGTGDGLQQFQPGEWTVKQEDPGMLDQNGTYGVVPTYAGYNEQMGRA